MSYYPEILLQSFNPIYCISRKLCCIFFYWGNKLTSYWLLLGAYSKHTTRYARPTYYRPWLQAILSLTPSLWHHHIQWIDVLKESEIIMLPIWSLHQIIDRFKWRFLPFNFAQVPCSFNPFLTFDSISPSLSFLTLNFLTHFLLTLFILPLLHI